MRQIKFRGKSLINSKWVCGDSIKHTENATDNGTEVLTYIGSRVENAQKVGAMKWVPVDPDTVGQFTGCITHDGLEIYEDDVVLLNDNRVAIVQFQQNLYEFLADFHHLDPEMKILGNIHDNPNLINR